MQLHTKIGLGLLAGTLTGAAIGPRAIILEPVGTAFLRLISMVIIPLVFSSLVVAIAGLGGVAKLGRLGLKSISYFTLAMTIAVGLGLALATFLRPGHRLNRTTQALIVKNYGGQAGERLKSQPARPSLTTMLLDLIPTNPLKAAAEGNLLQVIFFAMVFGVALLMIHGAHRQWLIDGLTAIYEVMIKLVMMTMGLAPFGVFAIMASTVGRYGLQILATLFQYIAVVMAGLLAQALLFYPVIVIGYGRRNLWDFFRAISSAQLLAFSTTSSAATLPVSIQCSEERLKIAPEVTNFVLPLGASLSRDGTAVYQAISAVFIAQVYGINLSLYQIGLIGLIAVLASMGTAAVPAGGFINLAIILSATGIPLEGLALVLGVDRILDMSRTMINVTGQLVGAVFINARSDG
ncbi:MAG: dicarboxylate/amino acid:cation symporter [Acidobacteria bacterium]|nr:dicarboxylate/amino acid:cation symporter [Acidobacteriota bacterium]MBI3656333.1 dicarboxylate/amino acid:cation symporter [Acidobacteriota bacterium]